MAAKSPAPALSPALRRVLVRYALISMVIAAIAGALTLWMSRELRGVQAETVAVRAQAERCESLSVSPPDPLLPAPPPQDRVQLENPYFGSEGVDVSALMRVRVAQVDARQRLAEIRFGAHSVLPAKSIHVLNLWAVWCTACKDEMPDLQRLFERRSADWGASVDFVALQVNDHSDPIDAYAQWAPTMPSGAIKLADRSMGEPVLKVLRGDTQRQPLFYGDMPVTMILDCNRRVRWAKFARLTVDDLRDLEAKIDDFRAELADTGADSRCTRVWCGNGRCEPGEAGSCVEDCGERSSAGPTASGGSTSGAAIEEPPPLPTTDDPPELAGTGASPPTCPSRCDHCTADGRCVPKLIRASTGGASEPTTPAARCGDTVCASSEGESSANCCRDCGCNAPLECLPNDLGEYACKMRLKH